MNLRDKPDWFLKISPHGKVPVLQVDGQPLFESGAIAEYLDEVVAPRLHPEDPIKRARNRAWTDFTPSFSSALGGVMYAKTPEAVHAGMAAAEKALGRLEDALATERGNDGPYFNGPQLSLVDAAYAPFLQRFQITESVLRTGLLDAFPRVRAWSQALLENPVVTGAVPGNFPEEYRANLKRREAHAVTLMEAAGA